MISVCPRRDVFVGQDEAEEEVETFALSHAAVVPCAVQTNSARLGRQNR